MKYADELEAKAKAATAAPWEVSKTEDFGGHPRGEIWSKVANKLVVWYGKYSTPEDMDFIAELANHAEDFVRLLRAAEEWASACDAIDDTIRKPASGPSRMRLAGDELRDAVAAFEEK